MLNFNSKIGTEFTTIYTTPSGKYCNISNIKINNTVSSSWKVELSLWNNKTKEQVILYSFYLESGQLINDDVIYQLSEGDKLIARSNITTVVINITGSEHATNTQ